MPVKRQGPCPSLARSTGHGTTPPHESYFDNEQVGIHEGDLSAAGRFHCAGYGAIAQQPHRTRLIGTTIYSSDGAEVGSITDVSLDEGGRLTVVRIDAAGSGLECEPSNSRGAP